MKRLTDGRQDATASPPVAERLEDATVGTLVYIDQNGQVRSTIAQNSSKAASVVALAALLGVSNWMFWLMGGPIGLAIGGGVTLLMTYQAASWRRIRRGVELIAMARLDEAEALLRPRARAPLGPPGMNARANQYLARIAALRGRHEDALALQELALQQMPMDRRWRAERRTLRYALVVTLVNLDQPAAARARFDAIERVLEGDYLRAQRAITELYLALGEGDHQFDPAYLEEQAEIALTLPSARALLGLLAWAREHARNHAEAARLLALARDRPGADLVARLYPKLAAWMD